MIIYMMMLNVRAKIQYGRTLLYEILSYFIRYPIEFLGAWIILSNFQELQGWNFYQILFLQAISFVLIATGCAITWEPMVAMEQYVVEGQLDKFLVAPINPFWYIIGINFRATNLCISAICIGISIYAAKLAGVAFTYRIIFYIIALLGGLLIVCSFNIFIGSLSFWITRSRILMSLFIDTLGEFLKYPISIYPICLQFVFSFIMPISLMNHFPAAYIFEKGNVSSVSMIGIFLVGLILFYISYRFWFLGVKHYKSAGG